MFNFDDEYECDCIGLCFCPSKETILEQQERRRIESIRRAQEPGCDHIGLCFCRHDTNNSEY